MEKGKTMKKLITIALVLILTLSFATCGGNATDGNNVAPTLTGSSNATANPDETESEPAQNPSADGQAMTSLIKWMMDGTFSYDYTMTSEGPEGRTESAGNMAMDGKNLAMTTETTVEGQKVKSRVIVKDGVTYIVDDVSKFIMTMQGGMNITEGMMADYSGIEKTGDGTGEINGKSLPYEEYTESEMGATVKYYLDGDQVYGIESEYEGYKTVMIITNASSSVPAGIFDLPEGYTQM